MSVLIFTAEQPGIYPVVITAAGVPEHLTLNVLAN
jgi:hypothetical protein